MSKPSIAYIYCTDVRAGDAHATQMLHSVRELAKYAQVTFITAHIPKVRLQEVRNVFVIPSNVVIRRLPVLLCLGTPFALVAHAFFVCMTLCILYRSSPDVVYTSDFGFLYALSLIPRPLRPKAPVIFEQHKVYHLVSKKVTYVQECRALAVAAGIITNSQGVYDDLVTHFSLPKEQLMVLHNAAALQFFESGSNRDFLKSRYGIGRQECVVVYSGSFLPWKGVEVLVRAAKYMQTPSARILLVGGVGEHRKTIEQLVKEEGVGGRVIVGDLLEPPVLAKVLCSADIGVIPNVLTTEGAHYTSPLKLFEYMASGLPIVAARLPTLERLLTQGRNCNFFEPGDEHALAEALDMLLVDTVARKSMRFHNKLDVKQYSYEARAQRMFAFIARYVYVPLS